MFLQLKNVIVIFYIINGTLQTIPAISTNSPLASFIPVAYVFIVGIILEGVAEYRRNANDKKFNHYKVNIVNRNNDGSLKEKEIKA